MVGRTAVVNVMVARHVTHLLAVVAEVSYCGGWVDGVAVLGNNSVETIDGVGGVVHDAQGAVGLHQAVLALDEVSVAMLGLRLDVTGQGVGNSVVV